MDYQQALKEVKKAQPKQEKFLMISFGYSSNYILPYKDALQVLSAFENAKRFSDGYSSKPPILASLTTSEIKTVSISHEEIQNIRVAQLMQLPVQKILDMQEEMKEIPLPF